MQHFNMKCPEMIQQEIMVLSYFAESFQNRKADILYIRFFYQWGIV